MATQATLDALAKLPDEQLAKIRNDEESPYRAIAHAILASRQNGV